MTDSPVLQAARRSTLAVQLSARALFRSDGPLACAVSGGADSIALAVLAALVHDHSQSVVLHHVDHGIRAESSGEAGAVADLAVRLGVGFVAHRVDVAPGPNVEERARDLRYAALPDDVATGHTADDLAETVLIQLLRGSGLDGVASMSRARHPGPQRPLLRVRRAETVALCAELGLSVLQDPMNDDRRFRRVRVRHELLPLMDDIARRDVAALLARHSEIVADDVSLLDELSAPIDPGARWGLVGVPLPLARRALRRWLAAGGVGAGKMVDAATLDRVLAVAVGEVISCDVIAGWRASRTDGTLRLEQKS